MSDGDASEDRCPKCGGEFEPGFLLDRFHPTAGQELLWAQADQAGLTVKPRDELTNRPREGFTTVDAWRCAGCGYLELFAGTGD